MPQATISPAPDHDEVIAQSADELVAALGAHQAGDEVVVHWVTSDGSRSRATVTLA